MPCTTYYTDQEVRYHQERLNDPEIQELLDELVALEGKTWFVRKDEHPVKRGLFRKASTVTLYELLADCGGEWQIINFPPEERGGWSINHDVSRAKVLTYLIAYIGAWHQAKWRERQLLTLTEQEMDDAVQVMVKVAGNTNSCVACDTDMKKALGALLELLARRRAA